jgi:signal transduction histidine kinase
MLCVGLGIVAIALVPATRAGSYLEFPYLHPLTPWGIRWLLVGAATIIPGLVAAAGAMRAPLDRSGSDRAIVSAAVLAGAGILPVVTGAALWHFSWPSLIVPMAAALAMVAILGLIAIGPLARSAGVFAMQRDLLAVGSDHERLRLAAALHDGPLSDVSVLVQRLDAAGDHENAALARAIADQLREVGNDLRLPIVEDLGVAAALEWLVGRTTSTTTPIALEVDEATRPPAEVEAAVYRVAQEALLNATRHGAPPVLVRYEAHIGQVTLLVRDAGTGIAAGAAERAQREGRLGLLMMHQRADAIGAQLAVELDPAGGTAVRLTWAPPSA